MLDTIWREARRRLQAELPVKDYEAWIEPLKAARWSPGELTLETPSGFFREWLKRHWMPALETAVCAASGHPTTVVLAVNERLDVPAAAVRAPLRPADPLTEPPPSRYTFDNFVVGASNRVAFGAAQAVVAQPGARFNPLFIHSSSGLGKTHLLSAITAALAPSYRRGAVVFVSAENFVNEMIAGLEGSRQMARFRNRFRGVETLVVDDVEFLGGKRRSQEEFKHTFNALHEGRKQIVLASDRPPYELPGFENTLRQRFGSGLLAHVDAPDPALRLALVNRKARALGLTLDADVAAHIADGWCANVRELEGALIRVDAYSSVAGRAVTLALVREALGAPRNVIGEQPSMDRVIGEVCQHFKVTRAEIASVRRTARVALPRQVAMYLIRQETDAPLAKIGEQLGGRDHATVLHALSAIERKLREDATMRETLTTLRARLH
jgi:chromosomal replication initiator protein